MSTIKSNNVQLGQSLTASQNFTLYQPASPDGTVRLGNGNAGSVTDLITLGSTGNLTFTGTTETYTNSVVISAASTKTLTLNGGAGSNGLVIDASNNVGIGGSPAVKLDVRSGSIGTQAFFGYGTGLATVSSNTGVATFAGNTSFSSSYLAYAQYTAASSIDFSSDGSIRLYTDSGLTSGSAFSRTERMRLDASGNLGLGVTPKTWGGNYRAQQIGYGGAIIAGNGTYSGYVEIRANAYINSTPSNAGLYSGQQATSYSQNAGVHSWNNTNNTNVTADTAFSFTQAMTLDASGRLMVGTTSNALGARYTSSDSNNAYPWGFGNINSLASFYISRATDGVGVYLGWGSTSWGVSSDERLKTNLKPIENATQKVSTLRAVIGRYKTDDESVSRSFLIAQDVQAVLPEAVDSEDPERLGVRYTDTIPLLVAAIKELSAEIETLKQRIK